MAEIEESIEELVVRAKGGCVTAFERVVELHQDRLFTYLVQLVGNAHDAEDLAQEAFIKAYRNLHSFDGRARFATWLFAIAKNTAFSHLRRRKSSQPIEELEEVLAAPDAPDRNRAESIWKEARKLKPKFFEVLWLFYAEGFSLQEAAQILKSNPITVRVNLYRARAALGKRLGRTCEPE